MGSNYFEEDSNSSMSNENEPYKKSKYYEEFIGSNTGTGDSLNIRGGSNYNIEGKNEIADSRLEENLIKAEITTIDGNLYIGPIYYTTPTVTDDSEGDNYISSVLNYKNEIKINYDGNVNAASDDIYVDSNSNGKNIVYVKANDTYIKDGKYYITVKNSFNVYKARILGFSTGSGQESVVASGIQEVYASYITYTAENSTDVTITKRVHQVNGVNVSDEIPNVQIGDTVLYEIEITNNASDVTTPTTLTDTFNSQLKIINAESYGWSGSGTSYSQTISSIGSSTITKYIKFEVGGYTTDASGNKSISDISRGEVLKNTATLSGLPESNKNGTEVSDDASVKVLGYNTTISKVVNKIYKLDNATETESLTHVESGDIVEYKITVTNNSGCVIKNIQIEDIIPSGMTYYSSSSTWEKSGNIYKYTGSVSANGSVDFYIRVRVDDNVHTNYGTLTNTATTKKYQNRGDVYVIEEESSSVAVTVLDYNYEITKDIVSITSGGVERTNNLDYAERGDIIKYEIKLTNNRDTVLYQINIKDTLPDGLTYIDYDEACNKGLYWEVTNDANIIEIKMKRDTVYRDRDSKIFYIYAKVTKDISTNDVTLTNTVETTQVKNRNGVTLNNVSDTEDIRILGYDYTINKEVSNIYKKDGTTSVESTTEAEPGDIVEYKITINKTGSGTIYNLEIEDILPTRLEYKGCSNDWVKSGNKYTYNGGITGNKELYIKTEVKGITEYKENIQNNAKVIGGININGENAIITQKESSVPIDVLGYNASLDKYIVNKNGVGVADRSGKSNEEN